MHHFRLEIRHNFLNDIKPIWYVSIIKWILIVLLQQEICFVSRTVIRVIYQDNYLQH